MGISTDFLHAADFLQLSKRQFIDVHFRFLSVLFVICSSHDLDLDPGNDHDHDLDLDPDHDLDFDNDNDRSHPIRMTAAFTFDS